MANNDRARKLLVRSALATSATIATFVGAQNVAMLDNQNTQFAQTPQTQAQTAQTVNTSAVNSSTGSAAPPVIQNVAPTIMIRHVAPSVVILRQSGVPQQTVPSNTNSSPNVSALVIQPPVPAVIAPPSPVVVQQQPVVVQQQQQQQQAPVYQAPVVIQQPVPQVSHSTR